MIAAALGAAVSAYNARDDYWSWVFPASIALGIAVSLTVRLPMVRRHAHDLVDWCRFVIVAGLAVVGILSSAPLLAVRLLLGLIGPAMVLYLCQSVVRDDAELAARVRELEAKTREVDALKMRATTLQSLNAVMEVQQAQAAAETAVFEVLLKRSAGWDRRRHRVAGHRRRLK